MIEIYAMIISNERGPSDWYGWKMLKLPAVPRIGESVSTNSGWTYRVTTVDYTENGTTSIIITTNPKEK